ncbi:MAG: FAD-dependent oxidoreductase, partial [Gammaproteobacteria bacterium]|nr:FAD-dependent oxidoreductase [Gammaproteobacteria bacterium]
NIARVMLAARERRAWMNIAPHLVHRQPFMIATSSRLTRSRPALMLASLAYWALTFSSSRSQDPEKRIPLGRLVSREEWKRLAPDIDLPGTTGGAMFHDALIHNSERLALAIARSAHEAGAAISNYVEAVDFLRDSARVAGVRARDNVSGEVFDIRARMVVATGGPWFNEYMQWLKLPQRADKPFLKVMYLMLRRPRVSTAVGLPAEDGSYYFVLPWQDRTLVGVHQKPADRRDLARLEFGEQDVAAFLASLNNSCPGLALKREDIVAIRGGLLPAAVDRSGASENRFPSSAKVIDHESADGVPGFISVVAIKYTMARRVAEKVVDSVLVKLRRPRVAANTHQIPAHGGDIPNFGQFLSSAQQQYGQLLSETRVRQLAHSYGTGIAEVFAAVREDPSLAEPVSVNSPVLKAQICHACRHEMVEKLSDVVFRRTALGIFGHPGQQALTACSEIVARELRWPVERREAELLAVEALFDTNTWGGYGS